MGERLEILVTASDQASSVFKGIGGAAKGILTVGLGAATAGFAALAGSVGFSIKEAMAAQTVQAQLNAVLESTGGIAGITADAANDLAEQLMGVTRFEDDAIVSGENMLLTFTNIGKDVFPLATQTMLDMSTALGQDLQGSAVQLGKALQDPVQGVSALARVGVNFTDAQKEMIAKMVESGDLMGAQTFILKELQTEFGGSAVAAGQTFAGQLDILKNSVGNVAENLGTQLLPQLQLMVSEHVVPFVEQYGPIFAQWLGEFIPAAIQTLTNFWSTILYPAINAVWSWMSTVLMPFLQTVIFPWLQTHIPAALQTLSNFWTTTLYPAIQSVWNWMSTVLVPFLQTVIFPWLAENIPAAIQTLTDFWTDILQPALSDVWNFLTVTMMPVWEALGILLGTTVVAAINLLVAAWTDFLKPALNALWDFVDTYVIPVLTTFWNWLGDVTGGIDGISSAISTVIGWIQKFIDWLGKLELPSWLRSQSPTPFEMGLRGIASAFDELNRKSLVEFNANLKALGGGQGSNTSYNLTINAAGGIVNPVKSFELMRVMAGA